MGADSFELPFKVITLEPTARESYFSFDVSYNQSCSAHGADCGNYAT
jgi:hypothetical protein